MRLNQSKAYQRVEAISASKIGQVAILLEHCVRLLDESIRAIGDNQIEQRFLKVDQVMVILNTITNNIDQESSSHAKGLSRFFQRMVIGLVDVNINNDAVMCGKIQTCLFEMAKIWRNADKVPETANVSSIETESAAQPSPEPGSVSIQLAI